MNRLSLAGIGLLVAALPVLAQPEPVEVVKPRGEFARKLSGATPPAGEGWKQVTDRQRRVQLTVPEGWQVLDPQDRENALRLAPPGSERGRRAALMVNVTRPTDGDPVDVEEFYALKLADALAEDPQLKRAKFQPTDAALVRLRGLKLALAGGTLERSKGEKLRLEQLVHLTEGAKVVVQFTAPESEFPRLETEVLRIFAGYQPLGTGSTAGE